MVVGHGRKPRLPFRSLVRRADSSRGEADPGDSAVRSRPSNPANCRRAWRVPTADAGAGGEAMFKSFSIAYIDRKT